MAARVIHFGIDDCYRLSVLRRAGYEIHDCSNVIQFRAALESETETDAIMLNDSAGSIPENLISIARSGCSAPIILFPHAARKYQTGEVDLVVPTLTPPHEWLLDLANLIIQARTLRAQLQLLREQSAQIRREAVAAREKSRTERARSRKETARNGCRVFPDFQDQCRDPE